KFAIPATLDCGPVAVGGVGGRLDVFLVRLREPEYLFQFLIVLAPACKHLNAQAAFVPRTGDDCAAVLVVNVLRSADLSVADPRLAVERTIWTVVKDCARE